MSDYVNVILLFLNSSLKERSVVYYIKRFKEEY